MTHHVVVWRARPGGVGDQEFLLVHSPAAGWELPPAELHATTGLSLLTHPMGPGRYVAQARLDSVVELDGRYDTYGWHELEQAQRLPLGNYSANAFALTE